MASRSLTPAQGDRAAGVLLGLACDDALGAGYEFGPARIHGEEVAISALTHGDREAGEACASPCGARRSATRSCTAASTASTSPCPIYRQTGLPCELSACAHAESAQPHKIEYNGWVIAALMAAWSAISRPRHPPVITPMTCSPPTTCARRSTRRRELAGAAGALQRALPQWRRILHGWPGPGSRDLIALGQLIAAEDRPTMRCTVRSRDVRVSKLPTRT